MENDHYYYYYKGNNEWHTHTYTHTQYHDIFIGWNDSKTNKKNYDLMNTWTTTTTKTQIN